MAGYRRAVAGLLLPAFLLLAFFPFHYHLYPAGEAGHHHADGGMSVQGHAHHTTDLHVLTDIGKVALHADSRTVDPSTHFIFKPGGPQLPLFVLAFALALTLIGDVPVRFVRPGASRPFRLLWRSSPPLRAPPRA